MISLMCSVSFTDVRASFPDGKQGEALSESHILSWKEAYCAVNAVVLRQRYVYKFF